MSYRAIRRIQCTRAFTVPVDNSDHSKPRCGLEPGVGKGVLGKAGWLPCLRGEAARLSLQADGVHHLPEEYIDEVELEDASGRPDSLITMGLKLISDSYLDGMSKQCVESGLAFEPRMMDGKHHIEILKDLAGSEHDLVVIGAVGIGRARDSVIGSVCERVARQSSKDVWVVKHVPVPGEAERDTILVGMDGSPQSFGAADDRRSTWPARSTRRSRRSPSTTRICITRSSTASSTC